MAKRSDKNLIRLYLIALVVIAALGYSYFQARNLIHGPQIVVTSHTSGTTVESSFTTLKGSARNIAFISLNDRQIFVDNDGYFSEDLLLAPGYNVVKLEAKDKFGRVVSKKIELVFIKSL